MPRLKLIFWVFFFSGIMVKSELVVIENKIYARTRVKKEFEKTVRPFVEKSLSDETRRAYGRVIKEFFSFHRSVEPAEIKPLDVIRWRDALIEKKKSVATGSFKLSVVRSLFEYLKVGGFVTNNPTLSKLVTLVGLDRENRKAPGIARFC